MRMASKEPIGNAYLISKYHTKGQTHQARRQPQMLRKSRMPFSEKVECRSDTHRDQHHAADRPHSKDQQVSHRPVRISDGGQNQKGHSRGAGKPMNYPDD